VELDLEEREREEFGVSVDGLVEDASRSQLALDTSEFFDMAEVTEGLLSEAARVAFGALRRGELDSVLIRGLPSDEDPGDTPNDVNPANTSKAPRHVAPPTRGHAWIATAVRRLGQEYSYALEKGGAIIHNIFPTQSGAKTQSNASWQVDLCLHSENAFHTIRPDFVTLYCVRAPKNPPSTHLVLIDDILPQLTDDEIALLREPRFTVRVVDSFLAGGAKALELPISIISGSARTPSVRWHETLRGNDESATNVLERFSEAAKNAIREVRLQEGDLLAFANDRCLHGRDRFDVRLDGSDRWLLRTYVRRDLAAIRPFLSPLAPQVIKIDLAANSEV
jgi:hypothetical protein